MCNYIFMKIFSRHINANYAVDGTKSQQATLFVKFEPKIKDAESLSTQNQQKIYIIYYESIYMCVNDLIQDTYNLQHGKLLLTTIDLKARYCRLPRLG